MRCCINVWHRRQHAAADLQGQRLACQAASATHNVDNCVNTLSQGNLGYIMQAACGSGPTGPVAGA